LPKLVAPGEARRAIGGWLGQVTIQHLQVVAGLNAIIPRRRRDGVGFREALEGEEEKHGEQVTGRWHGDSFQEQPDFWSRAPRNVARKRKIKVSGRRGVSRVGDGRGALGNTDVEASLGEDRAEGGASKVIGGGGSSTNSAVLSEGGEGVSERCFGQVGGALVTNTRSIS